MKEPIADAIKKEIARNRSKILKFLAELVRCNSFTHNKQGVDAVADLVAREMPADFTHDVIEDPVSGNHHVFHHAFGARAPVLLSGHLDTVCPAHPTFNSMREEGALMRGPGTYDMKGGDVVMVWALKVLEACGFLSKMDILCIFSGDEEQGSPGARAVFSEYKHKASLALVYEGGGKGGGVVTQRRGVLRYRLHSTGKAGHSGLVVGQKASAIEELAHQVLAIEALNTKDGTVCANVGRIEGGVMVNAVPAKASMDFEVRYWDRAVGARIESEIVKMMETPKIPGCTNRLDALAAMPPMMPTAASLRVFDVIQQSGRALGVPVMEEKRGGSSDGCFFSELGIPTIDGLGPIGDGDHSEEEHIITESLFDRIALTAHVLIELHRKDVL